MKRLIPLVLALILSSCGSTLHMIQSPSEFSGIYGGKPEHTATVEDVWRKPKRIYWILVIMTYPNIRSDQLNLPSSLFSETKR
jgi:hypothetical protein